TAAPCSDERRMRRSALPSVSPKPRSSGSATTVAERRGSLACTCSLSGRISSCQFFWITLSAMASAASFGRGPHSAPWGNLRRRRTPGRPPDERSNAPALARPAAVVRDRGHVADRRDGEAGGLKRAQRRLAAGARARHPDFQRAHAVFHRLLRRVFRRHLRGERGRLARALEALRAGGRPRDGIALRVGYRDHGVVERGVDVRDARGDVFTLALAYARGFLAHARPFR